MLKIQYAKLEENINDILCEHNAELVKKHVNDLQTSDGNFCSTKLWNLKKKLCPSNDSVPIAKYDKSGNLITAPETLNNLYRNCYIERLQPMTIMSKHMMTYEYKIELLRVH